jgi:cholesterol oxidase
MVGFDYDVIVIGSGFGGSVTALRLSEKGYRVGVLEAGMRFTDDTLPDTNWDARKFLWAPRLGLKGMQKITLLRDVMVLSGAGVGGGSLVYANTLYEPMQPFYEDAQWRHITDWRSELAPYYDQAKRMLGVVDNPTITPADVVMKSVADEMGRGDTFHVTPVGVFFGDGPGVPSPDPFFGGVGPERAGCIQCGNCMVGCKHNAKNRLDKNYLYLAERLGAVVHAETTVTALRPRATGGWDVDTLPTGTYRKSKTRTFTAEQVVLAAGALGTQKILHKMRDTGVLPRLSPTLGHRTRTNSEAILGATSRRKDVDYSKGVAITSSWHPDENTHIEPVRYGPRNNAMKLMSTVMTDPVPGEKRWKTWAKTIARNPSMLRVLLTKKWSEQTIIVLVMQSLDNSLVVFGKKTKGGGYRLTSRQGHGHPNPTTIPVGNEATRRVAEKIDGVAGGGANEIADIPMTAHILGGCVIGDSPETGVIDPYHRVYGYDGLHVVDGAAVSANLGVNPSLTITAQAERAMSLWPNQGEPDPRPPVGAAYERIAPVPPHAAAVPEHAPAALRLVPATAANVVVEPTPADSADAAAEAAPTA